jgi:glycerol-3-phosphate O-acyltransferase 3/4
LFPLWLFGCALRYLVLLPIRVTLLLFGSMALLPILIVCNLTRTSQHLFVVLVQWYCSLWVMAMTGVVKYSGLPPVRRPNQIYVANHTCVL